ncbi:hypothetical protein Tco_0296173 [Tanacetum coccineum]
MTFSLRNNTPFISTMNHSSFSDFKEKLTEAPIGFAPDGTSPLRLMCDAISDYDIGQESVDIPTACHSGPIGGHYGANYTAKKERTKKLHDSKIKNRIFNVGDQVLLFNSVLKIFSGKIKPDGSAWPFNIPKFFHYGTAKLSSLRQIKTSKVMPPDLSILLEGHTPALWLSRISRLSLRTNEFRDRVELVTRYGYCKNLKKTVKTGQSRTRETEEYTKSRENAIKSQQWSTQSLTSQEAPIGQFPKENDTRGLKKAHKEWGFYTKSCLKEAQRPPKHGCHVGNPCAPQSNPTVDIEHQMIEGMKSQD